MFIVSNLRTLNLQHVLLGKLLRNRKRKKRKKKKILAFYSSKIQKEYPKVFVWEYVWKQCVNHPVTRQGSAISSAWHATATWEERLNQARKGESREALVVQTVKNLLATQETWVRSLGQEDPLEKEMTTDSSVLAWRIPWTEEPGGLQSMGSQGRAQLGT